jgi:hypothetical protein
MAAVDAGAVTVLYNDQVVEVENVLADPTDLWVSPEDLTRINGFELKPEGACLDSICIPLKQDADSEEYVIRDGKPWVNVTALARKLQQAYAADHEKGVWSFGAIPATRETFLTSAMAPDFELEDREGNTVRLQDFRGKKVLLITWASW